jgi:hypothetical protein
MPATAGTPNADETPGDDLPWHAGPRERLHFLTAAPEQKRVPPLQTHHGVALSSVLDQEPVDLLLKCGSGP